MGVIPSFDQADGVATTSTTPGIFSSSACWAVHDYDGDAGFHGDLVVTRQSLGVDQVYIPR